MYKVFNMGHRFEIYIPEDYGQEIIDIVASYKVDARIIGRCYASNKKRLTIKSHYGEFVY